MDHIDDPRVIVGHGTDHATAVVMGTVAVAIVAADDTRGHWLSVSHAISVGVVAAVISAVIPWRSVLRRR